MRKDEIHARLFPPIPFLLCLVLGSSTVTGAASPPPGDGAAAPATTFPAESWETVDDPAAAGWDVEALAAAETLFHELESAALVAVHRGRLIASWGTTDERYTAQSVRKSLVSALIGTEVDAGRLHLDDTLADLGIDDEPPLTPAERTATLRDLMLSRSGIYRPSVYEHGSWKRRKPEPGTDAPGTAWFYNNWGFNAAGTIFEHSSGTTVGEGFAARIARPLQMEDYRPEDVVVLTRDSPGEKMAGNDSTHPAHVFRVSTRDLARFGLLYLERGRWGDRQLLSPEWLDASFEGLPTGYNPGERYGLLWWIYGDDSPDWPADLAPVYLARGNRGHVLAILPHAGLVVAHQVATGGLDMESQLKRLREGSPTVSYGDVARLVTLIARAAPKE